MKGSIDPVIYSMKKEYKKPLKNIRLNKELYGNPYRPIFFTIASNFRQAYFTMHQFNIQIIKCFKRTFNKAKIMIPVYCLMPDHLHFIIYLIEKGKNILDMVNYFKSNSSKIGKNYNIINLWQRRYYDHIIRKEEALKKICEYIYNNPVRKGLVKNSDDYKYSEIKYDLINI